MDDFKLQNLHESKNEWVARLVTMLTPCIFKGFKTLFDEAVKMSENMNQPNKYLMTFQNLLVQIPKWNNEVIQNETQNIIETTQCNYISDLIACVHIIQLKALTCVRVGQTEKDVNINIPKLEDFIHKVYINCARNIYSNIYLFEQELLPIKIQQNYNKVDKIIKENIIETVRQSMPVEDILRAYLEDSVTESYEEPKETTEPTQEIQPTPTPASENEIQEPLHNLVSDNVPDEIAIAPPEEIFSMETMPEETFSMEPKSHEKIEEYNPILEEELPLSLEAEVPRPSDMLTSETDFSENINKEEDTLKEHNVTFSGLPDDNTINILDLEDADDALLGVETLS